MAETSEPSCCPAGSAGYLAADYATAGAFASFGEGAAKVDCYVSGDAAARRAVILAPDVWGWNSGRTRAFADPFGRAFRDGWKGKCLRLGPIYPWLRHVD